MQVPDEFFHLVGCEKDVDVSAALRVEEVAAGNAVGDGVDRKVKGGGMSRPVALCLVKPPEKEAGFPGKGGGTLGEVEKTTETGDRDRNGTGGPVRGVLGNHRARKRRRPRLQSLWTHPVHRESGKQRVCPGSEIDPGRETNAVKIGRAHV